MLWMIRSCTPELSQEPARGGVGRSPSWSAEGEGEGWGDSWFEGVPVCWLGAEHPSFEGVRNNRSCVFAVES